MMRMPRSVWRILPEGATRLTQVQGRGKGVSGGRFGLCVAVPRPALTSPAGHLRQRRRPWPQLVAARRFPTQCLAREAGYVKLLLPRQSSTPDRAVGLAKACAASHPGKVTARTITPLRHRRSLPKRWTPWWSAKQGRRRSCKAPSSQAVCVQAAGLRAHALRIPGLYHAIGITVACNCDNLPYASRRGNEEDSIFRYSGCT